jgi:hypothetical protein
MPKSIPLTQGKIAIVDDEDYDWLCQYKWHAIFHDKWYAATGKKHILMHRILLGITDKTIWGDHKDGDGLNNVRKNIRVTTPLQNGQNKKKFRTNKSGYRGVHLIQET